MTQISAKIVADSKNEFGNRITTMVVTFPRMILAELNTHRMFSRNSASSRAIPFEKMLESVQNNPFIPIAWQKDHKGMQGTEYFNEEHQKMLNRVWLSGRDKAVESAQNLAFGIGVHEEGKEDYNIEVTKQLCNRLLEPFMYHTVIITATEWENFFYLRCPKYSLFSENMPVEFRGRKDLLKYVNQVEAPEFKNQYDNLTELDWLNCNKGQAEIHMMALAEAMWDAYNESTPKELKAGEWHIPFGDNIDETSFGKFLIKQNEINKVSEKSFKSILTWEIEQKIKIATARCARVSYTVVGEEGKPDNYENDINLHDRLAASGHWSPFEHCAKAMNGPEYHLNRKVTDVTQHNTPVPFSGLEHGWSGNFRGFIQYRKTFQGENKTK